MHEEWQKEKNTQALKPNREKEIKLKPEQMKVEKMS